MKHEYYEYPISLMGNAINRFDISNPKIYGNFLAQTYYYVSHSTRLLAFAAGLMKSEDEHHFRRFVKHIAEESSHEVLAEKDLEDLGMHPNEFYHLPETRALWEPQYYKTLHESPLALMGYIIALEYFSCTHLPLFYQKVSRIYGNKAGRFVKLHAEEDPEHIEKALALTSTLPASLQEVVLVNIVQTAKTYTSMIEACEKTIEINPIAKTLLDFRQREF